jgi:hypothetical protein
MCSPVVQRACAGPVNLGVRLHGRAMSASERFITGRSSKVGRWGTEKRHLACVRKAGVARARLPGGGRRRRCQTSAAAAEAGAARTDIRVGHGVLVPGPRVGHTGWCGILRFLRVQGVSPMCACGRHGSGVVAGRGRGCDVGG